jgi:hypothetical protein
MYEIFDFLSVTFSWVGGAFGGRVFSVSKLNPYIYIYTERKRIIYSGNRYKIDRFDRTISHLALVESTKGLFGKRRIVFRELLVV